MTPDRQTIERVARAINDELCRQDYDGGFNYPEPWDMMTPYLDQGEVDFAKVAEAAIAAALQEQPNHG